MKTTQALKSLSDDELLRRLSDVLKQSRRVESDLVAHIAEVDTRRLFARQASPSMFQYCIDVLHFSKAETDPCSARVTETSGSADDARRRTHALERYC